MSTNEKNIILKSSDGVKFELCEEAARLSETVKNMIEDTKMDDNGFLIPTVNGDILSKVVKYCEKHVNKAIDGDDDMKIWDAEFVKVDIDTLIDIVMAANFLNNKGLLDLTCQAVASGIKDKSVEEVREIFGIENDFTPEEEENLRLENEWAFEI